MLHSYSALQTQEMVFVKENVINSLAFLHKNTTEDERRNKIVEETIDAKIAKEYRTGLTDIATRYRSKPVEISKERQTRGYVPPPVDWPEDKKKKWNKIQAMLGRYPGKEDCLATRSSRSCSYYLWGTGKRTVLQLLV